MVIWVNLGSKYSIHKAVVFTVIHFYSSLVEWLQNNLRERNLKRLSSTCKRENWAVL